MNKHTNKVESSDADVPEDQDNDDDSDPNANCPPNPETECSIPVVGGWIVSPAYPADCDYVRVVDLKHYERGYWHFNEWAEDPQVVMGAVMGLLREVQNEGDERRFFSVYDSNDTRHELTVLNKVIGIQKDTITSKDEYIKLLLEIYQIRRDNTLYSMTGIVGVTNCVAAFVIGVIANPFSPETFQIPAVIAMATFTGIGFMLMYWANRGLASISRKAKEGQPCPTTPSK